MKEKRALRGRAAFLQMVGVNTRLDVKKRYLNLKQNALHGTLRSRRLTAVVRVVGVTRAHNAQRREVPPLLSLSALSVPLISLFVACVVC